MAKREAKGIPADRARSGVDPRLPRTVPAPWEGGSRDERPAKKGESWWYKEKEDKPKKEDDGWWYKDKPEDAGSEKDAVKDSRSPVGGQ